MNEYMQEYEEVLKALERLHGKTQCAAKFVTDLDYKVSHHSLANQFQNIRARLRLLYPVVKTASKDVAQLKCICPTVTKNGMRFPTIIDAHCPAYEHGGLVE